MTNNEIVAISAVRARSLSEDCQHGYERRTCFPCTTQAFYEAIREAVVRAHGEAMHAMCFHCLTGIQVVNNFGDGNGEGVRHKYDSGEYTLCDAEPIHALVDVLIHDLPEPVKTEVRG